MDRTQLTSSALGALAVTGCVFLVGVRRAPVGCLTPEQEAVLSRMQLVLLDDGQGGSAGTVRFAGVNVQIVDGSGTTVGETGVGNLIVGYNEFGNPGGDDRTGAHNIVVGQANNYTSYGGLVVAHQNAITAPFAAVSGGSGNVASAEYASVTGGQENQATAQYAHVGGGLGNIASGAAASVAGGYLNTAGGDYSSVGGGSENKAMASNAAVSGGRKNRAVGDFSTVSAGRNNQASGNYSSVSGGFDNRASGFAASVSGGASRNAPSMNSWAAGSLFEIN